MSKKEKLIESAQKSIQKGQVAKAIKDYQKILEMESGDIRSRQKLAELLGRDRRIHEALEEYDKVARHYSDTGFFLKAIAVYKQIQKLDPAKTDVYYKLAELNEKQGLTGNALAEYRNLVSHYEKEGLIGEAVKVLEKMKDIDPENLNVHLRIVEISFHGKLKDRGTQGFKEALEIFQQKGDFPRLLKLYEIILPHFPKDVSVQSGFAQALIRNNEPEKGVQALKGILHRDPENTEVQKMLADGYRATGDYENERLTCQHLLKTLPDDLDLREKFVRAAIDSAETVRALDALEGWRESFFDAGRIDALKGFYEGLLRSLPDEDRIHKTLHTIRMFTGESKSSDVGIPPVLSSEIEISLDTLPSLTSPVPNSPILSQPLEDSFDEIEDLEEIEEIESLSECESKESAESHEERETSENSLDSLEIDELPLDFLESLVLGNEESTIDDSSSSVSIPVDVDVDVDVDVEPDDGIADLIDLEVSLQPDEESFEELDPIEDDLEELLEIDLTDEDEDVVEEPFDIQGELEEAEFYLQQGLLDEAQTVCQKILAVDRANADALDKLDEIAKLKVAEPRSSETHEELFDLATELAGEVLPDLDEVADRFFDDSFTDSQRGIETEISQEDTESHYNLGIAYKEMGLLDDAISEFEQAMRAPERSVDCLTLKGLCLIEKGSYEEGELVFKSALQQKTLNDLERISLNYEMGLLYEAWNRPLDALDSFQSVLDSDSFYRDVGDKVVNLRHALGLDTVVEKNSNAKGNKDRVSYV